MTVKGKCRLRRGHSRTSTHSVAVLHREQLCAGKGINLPRFYSARARNECMVNRIVSGTVFEIYAVDMHCQYQMGCTTAATSGSGTSSMPRCARAPGWRLALRFLYSSGIIFMLLVPLAEGVVAVERCVAGGFHRAHWAALQRVVGVHRPHEVSHAL